MKSRILLAILAGIGVFLTTWAAQRPETLNPELGTREAMRLKLGFAQRVLEGLALENYGQILTNAQKLSQLSRVAGWRARQTPEYELFTNEFRRQADALADAAREKNIDGAAIAYTQLTFSCTSCHKYMRSLRTAKAE